MTQRRQGENAFGRPGVAPRWTHGDKDGVGTAYNTASRVWFTLWNGLITEIYYPAVDQPQTHDWQMLITDGKTFFHDEKRGMRSETRAFDSSALGYTVVNSDPDGRYRMTKTVISDPHLPCVLQRVRLTGDEDFLQTLQVYTLCAPHLGIGGAHNDASVVEAGGRTFLTAEKNGVWLALAASVPFRRVSCGYVGARDGWTDLNENFQMDWQFTQAVDGNVALTGELDLSGTREFTLALAFGGGRQRAVTTLMQSLCLPFEQHQERFEDQWGRAAASRLPLEDAGGDGGRLYRRSVSLMQAHGDKTFQGAFVASLATPWGEARGDEETGGYHLIWGRDLFISATGLLASGDLETPLRALIYLAASQQADGGWPQNFRLDGEPYWSGVQLDQAAYPIILAYLLKRADARQAFDPAPMARAAAAFLIRQGPATPQERWEEASGYSPSTLAAVIAALVCAGTLAREAGHEEVAGFIETYADFLESNLERWTVTQQGTLLSGVTRHYVRIAPGAPGSPPPDAGPDGQTLALTSQPPHAPRSYPAEQIVDAGFLELVRLGVRPPDDPLIVDSLRVVDAVLKVDTPAGPGWRRYNHDGYGQRPDGGPYQDWGQGRVWPLLTGERGVYELAAGRDAREYLRTLEGMAGDPGLLAEQVWDEDDRPDAYLFRGRPTGSACPLVWPHSQYVRLLRAVHDGYVGDIIPEVAARYGAGRQGRTATQIWDFNYPALSRDREQPLRVHAASPFRLHWSADDWQTVQDLDSTVTVLGIHYADMPPAPSPDSALRFTFFWTESGTWEGRDFCVATRP